VVVNALLDLAPGGTAPPSGSPAARLAARRLALEAAELARLGRSLSAPVIRLPLLPLPPGPELLRALVHRLEEAA